MLTVTHTCGHTQATNIDRIAARSVEMGLKTEGQAKIFVDEQVAWLSRQMCLQCYCTAKETNPDLKPRP